MAGSIYVPGHDDVMRTLGVSSEVAFLPYVFYTLGLAFGPMVSAPTSEAFGRKIIYLVGIPFFALFTLGAGFSQNISSLTVCRFFAGVFGSTGLAAGTPTLTDVWAPAERGIPMALYVTAPFLGPTLGPLIGGYVAQSKGWRWTQWVTLFFTVVFLMPVLFMSETYKKQILKRRAKRQGRSPSNSKRTFLQATAFFLRATLTRPLHMMTVEPIVGLFSLYVALNFATIYNFYAAFPYVFSEAYAFDLGAIGLTFLGMGIGVLLASSGIVFIDRHFYRKRFQKARLRGEKLAPEHRLYIAMISQLEHILVDTDGAYRSGFKDAITPCSNYFQGPQTLGRETAAQWLRVAFHDFVTAHVGEGTGGIDASIGFETAREENSGTAFNDSFSFWASYVNAHVSMADVLALGTVTSVGNCGGPRIPYRGGRIDATGPGASGVPAPDTDLATTLSFFANAGFNQVDSIKLTACGHTLGSVHHGGFPTVMDNSTVSPNNTQGAGHLDSTNAEFDIDVVEEYVSGTGQRGGPLVTSFNESSRSDLRLYESDNNATMQGLAKGGTEGFFGTCVDLLARMLNTVPANVRLTDVVEPMKIKPVNVTFDIDETGTMILTGAIRVRCQLHISFFPRTKIRGNSQCSQYLTTAMAPTSMTISAGTAAQKASALSAQGSSIFGTTSFYPFTLAFPPTSSNDSLPTSLNVASEVDTSQTYPLEPHLFFAPSLSSISPASAVNSSFVNIVAALAPSVSSPVAVVAFPVFQMGTLAPKMTRQNVTLEAAGTKAGYSLVGGNATLPTGLMGQVSVDIVAMVDGMKVADVFNFVPQT
ncbi:MAG: hypothetical protein Q9165_000703 [Trypethelium subeluteriae]